MLPPPPPVAGVGARGGRVEEEGGRRRHLSVVVDWHLVPPQTSFAMRIRMGMVTLKRMSGLQRRQRRSDWLLK